MNQAERTFFLATIESLESTFNAQLKALRAIIALSQNTQADPAAALIMGTESLDALEEQFERSIFSLEETK